MTSSSKVQATQQRLDFSEIQSMEGDETVEIIVGSEDRTKCFHVRKELLCNKVPFFEKMFKSGFKEGITNITRFPDDDQDAFELFLSWIETGELPGRYPAGPRRGQAARNLYTLVDKLCLRNYMDELMDDYRRFFASTFPGIDLMWWAYSDTPTNSGMRRYISSCVCYILEEYREKFGEEKWPTEELDLLLRENDDLRLDILKMQRAHRPGTRYPDPRYDRISNCAFHEHIEGEQCYDYESPLYAESPKRRDQDSKVSKDGKDGKDGKTSYESHEGTIFNEDSDESDDSEYGIEYDNVEYDEDTADLNITDSEDDMEDFSDGDSVDNDSDVLFQEIMDMVEDEYDTDGRDTDNGSSDDEYMDSFL